MRVTHINAPLFEIGSCSHKLLVAHTPVIARVDAVEGNPQLIVHPQVLEQPPKLRERNVVITVLAARLHFSLSRCERPHQHWLHTEELGQLEHIAHSLVHLSQREVTIPVHIEVRPNLSSLGLLLFIHVPGELFL